MVKLQRYCHICFKSPQIKLMDNTNVVVADHLTRLNDLNYRKLTKNTLALMSCLLSNLRQTDASKKLEKIYIIS